MTATSLRDTLVNVGVTIVDVDGPAELTLREIARRSGVSHGAPRRYFPTHNSLLAAIATRGLSDLAGRLTPALHTEQSVRDRIISAATEYVTFARERPAMFELMFRHDLLDGAGENLRQTSLPLFTALRAVVDDDEMTALAVWTGVHGIAVLVANRSLDAVAPHADVTALIDAVVTAHLSWKIGSA
ncbi:AcrR family transcriptional regulator [Rhodococcus sp. 27YEA15]|uniref:TetR/AcrR family transcriptional regulator n=1 Tax=Rhodococcus sp. 27YEA15 TaxID=3156259 RepID=UPI003C7DF439